MLCCPLGVAELLSYCLFSSSRTHVGGEGGKGEGGDHVSLQKSEREKPHSCSGKTKKKETFTFTRKEKKNTGSAHTQHTTSIAANSAPHTCLVTTSFPMDVDICTGTGSCVPTQCLHVQPGSALSSACVRSGTQHLNHAHVSDIEASMFQ